MNQRFAPALVAGLATVDLSASLYCLAANQNPKPGTIVTFAGNGTAGYSGDGGPAVQAMLNAPAGLAFDSAGDLFIPEAVNHRVREVTPNGVITTIAGTGPTGLGQGGYSGDSGHAIKARLNAPQAVVVDGAGNLFIADTGNNRVRRVPPDGFIATIAGGGRPTRHFIDGGSATDASLDSPTGLAVDGEDNLYIAEASRVRKVTPSGTITTVAGGGSKEPDKAEGGRAIEANLSPTPLAVDAAGNLFIGDSAHARVWKVSRDGIIKTVAGTGQPGFTGDGGKATQAQINTPHGLAVDTAHNLFIAEVNNRRVRKVSPDGMIQTVAGGAPSGSGRDTYSGEGGPATAAHLAGPLWLAIDAGGNLFISESGAADDQRVLKVLGAAAPGLIAGKPFPAPR
jgi:hypothetical protein